MPRGGTVLLVDDELIVRNSSRRLLEQRDFTVLCAGDGQEAVEVFRERKDEIRFVMLDLVMPIMGGEETYHALRQIDDNVKVVIVSGYAADQKADEILAAGADCFLQKPYDALTLNEAISKLLAG